MYQKRFYRDFFKSSGLIFFSVVQDETDLYVGAKTNLFNETLELVKNYREQIETWIKGHPEFLKSLKPVEIRSDMPYIVRRMAEAGLKAGTGPMAAVAGAISEMVGQKLLDYSDEIIVENGGDIYLKIKEPRKVGIYAGESPLSGRIALEINSEDTPVGICTSSGTVGHSLSFGKADAAVVVSKDTFLSDAAATALGNLVKKPGDIPGALDFILGVEGVEGALVIKGDRVGVRGNIKLLKL
ncbi:MAG TPA: UPF0280 family protein [Clostridiaceae bacterium]|nr:UPF0280 family protein [Clostridiaceae bacterium]